MNSNKLLIKDLNVNYKNKVVLKNINLELKEGEVNILLGLNGAGKTTLLKSIAGVVKNIDGKMIFNDTDLNTMDIKQKAKIISYIPQNMHSNQSYTALDIVVMGITPYLKFFEQPQKEHYIKAMEIMKKLNIFELKDKSIGELSGGERRIVYLARILMQKCKIVLLDEPNTFLDYVRQQDFFSFITSFIKENKLISLFTIHDINLAIRYAEKLYFLHENNVIECVDCTKYGYENKILYILEKVYKRKFDFIHTEKGDMVIS